ncbi:MAG TPA: hypothetical protein VHX59_07310 [Mycobacteriales bacterium]|jgi:hypothetical protein|nr:hypothetical protein [Mycobacteriales bacterium]
MTHTMIWTFGFLAFFLLLIAVSNWSPGRRGHDVGQYRKLAAKAAENQEHVAHRLDEIGAQLGELQTRLASMERILKEVE